MKLKELHKDIERYLEEDFEDTGFVGQIYSTDNFFYSAYSGDEEIISLGEGENNYFGNLLGCIENVTRQILLFTLDEAKDKIIRAVRFDATDNNIDFVKGFISNKYQEAMPFEYFDDTLEEKILKYWKQHFSHE